jgi:hypothetical protein
LRQLTTPGLGVPSPAAFCERGAHVNPSDVLARINDHDIEKLHQSCARTTRRDGLETERNGK